MKTKNENKINALIEFRRAYNKLSEVFDNEFMTELYPFQESFNEINVGEWTAKSIESIVQADLLSRFDRFINSRVKMTKLQINKLYGVEIMNNSAYVYLDSFFIEITDEGLYWTYASNDDCSGSNLRMAEEWLFENIQSEIK